MPLRGGFRPFPRSRDVTINPEGEGVLMRSRFVRTLLVAVMVLSWTFAVGATRAAAVSPVPPLPGVVPSEGFALLAVSIDLEPAVAVTVLSGKGCDASWIAVSADGGFVRYWPDGEVDAGFPDELTAGTVILVLCTPVSSDLDLANGSYELDGLVIDLVDGESEFPAAPGSASMVTTMLTEWQAAGDLDADRVVDVSGALVHSTGGTGNFRYLVTLLSGGETVPGMLLGDRILVEGLSISGGVIEVDYLDRAFDEGFAVEPTVPAARGFTLSLGALIEAPSGEWRLVSLAGAALVDGTAIDADFSGGVVSGSGGCNGYSGGYEIAGDELVLGQPIASTAMACEPAILDQELAYFVALQAAERFSIGGDTLTIETGSGDLTFLRAGVEPTGDWSLTSLAGDAVLAGAPITASFDGEVVAGSAGCNQYSGGYVVDGLAVALEGPIAVTLMACETAIMDQETAYLAALAGAARFSMSGDTLTIESGSGDLTFERAS
jgi:heat shock protein HslJ